jgi:hypothetical protein
MAVAQRSDVVSALTDGMSNAVLAQVVAAEAAAADMA